MQPKIIEIEPLSGETDNLLALYGVSVTVQKSSKHGDLTPSQSLEIALVALDHAKTNKVRRGLTIVCFPELCVYGRHSEFVDALDKWEHGPMDSPTLLVIGAYISDADDRSESTNQSVLVLLHGTKSQLEVHWQPKITQAREELSPSTPLRTSQVHLFKYHHFHMAALTCSDLFQPPLGQEKSVLELVRNTEYVTHLLVLNPQFSRSPDDIDVLRHLEYAINCHRPGASIAVMQTNVVYEGVVRDRVAGRFLAGTKSSFPLTEKVKGLSPHLRGLEYPWQQGLYFMQCNADASGNYTCISAAFTGMEVSKEGIKVSWNEDRSYISKTLVAIEPMPEVRLRVPSKPVKYARALRGVGEVEAAEKILRDRLHLPLESGETIKINSELCTILQQQGRYDEAFKLYSAQYKNLSRREREQHLDESKKRDLELDLLKVYFQKQHTRTYLQLGNLPEYASELMSLDLRAENLAVNMPTNSQVGNEINKQRLNLKRHLLQCKALHEPNSVSLEELDALVTDCQARNLFRESLYVRVIKSNLLRSVESYDAAKNEAESVLRLAQNIGDARLAENALRCIGEVCWVSYLQGKLSDDSMRYIWKDWQSQLATPRSPFIDFYLKLCRARWALWLNLNGISVDELNVRVEDLDESIFQRYSNTSDLLLQPLTLLIRDSVHAWAMGKGGVEEFRRVANPFIVLAENNSFWRLRALSKELKTIRESYSLNTWKSALLLPNFQLWG